MTAAGLIVFGVMVGALWVSLTNDRRASDERNRAHLERAGIKADE